MVMSISFLIISLLFPILIYFIYLVYSDLKNDKEREYILDLVLLTSFYLAVIQDYMSLFTITLINIPLIISIIKKRLFSSFLLIVLISMQCHSYTPSISLTFFLLEYLIIYVLINVIKKYEINVFFGIKLFFLIFLRLMWKIDIIKISTSKFIFNLFLIYLIFIAFKYIYLKLESIVVLRFALAETIKEQKRFQDLFKIAHEVKNPLSVCKGYLQMLNLKDKEKSEKYIHMISLQINKTLEILKDFSNISNLKINKQSISLNLLLEEIEQEVSLFNTADLSIKTKIPSNDIVIDADFNRIKQVLLNVVKNAKEAIVKKGTIIINLYEKKNYAYIKVVDDGIGMDFDTMNNLYTPFFTTKKNGTGLGVCLSKEIIEKHDGKMEYYSNENKGTKVIIKLPLKKASS